VHEFTHFVALALGFDDLMKAVMCALRDPHQTRPPVLPETLEQVSEENGFTSRAPKARPGIW
jgi:hypothetical protein